MTPEGIEDSLLRGTVVELAVAVVIGAASTAVVDQFAESFLTPLADLVGGGGQLGGAFEVDGQVFTWGAFVSQLVTFVMTAAVIYSLVVLPMEARRGEEPGPAQPTQVGLLARDPRPAACRAGRRSGPGPVQRLAVNSRTVRRTAALLQGPAPSLRVVGGRRVLSQSLPQCGGRSSR